MSDTIVVGVDGSVPSRGAIRWAAARALSRGDGIRLVHVLDERAAAGAALDADAGVNALLHAGEALARAVAGDIPISWHIVRGDPVEMLSANAGDHGLLVVGTHKTGFIHGTSFGSRFLALATSARCPVAFIPDLAGSVRDGIVVGVQDGGDATVRSAAEEASATSQSLTLVRARADLPPDFDPHISHAVVVSRAVDESLSIRTRRLPRPLAAALVECAARSSLLVVRHPSDAASAALTHDVLLNISSPTLISAAEITEL